MTGQRTGPSSVARRWEQVLAFLSRGGRPRGVFSAMAIAAATLALLLGIASEGRTVEDTPPVEIGSADKFPIAQAASTAADEAATGSSRAEEPAWDWTMMLRNLGTSAEARQMMIDVEALLRQGDATRAKQTLSAFIETGSLAVIMIDHIQEPALRASLQKVAADRQNSPALASPHTSMNGAAANEVKMAELKDAFEQERNRADAAERELSATQGQVMALKATEAKATELKAALEQEKERAALAARQLSAAQEQITALSAGMTETAKISDALRQERERAAASLRELNAVKGQIAALENRQRFTPAALAFQLPLSLNEPLADTLGDSETPRIRDDKGSQSPRRKDRQVSLPQETKVPAETMGGMTSATPRTLRQRMPSEELGMAKPQPDIRNQSAAPDKKDLAKQNRSPRLLAQDVHDAPDTRPPSLPNALQPDGRLWQLR
jgi:hypothetical protein